MYTTRNNLAVAARKAAMPMLPKRLEDSVEPSTQVEQAHWNVKRPSYIAFHERFDKVAELAEDRSNLLAERSAALGGHADGLCTEISREIERQFGSVEAHVQADR